MTQSDRVLGTPPTNAPINPSRRNLFNLAAGGVIVAAIPTAALAGTSDDPVLALIAAYRVADVEYLKVIHAQSEAEEKFGVYSEEAGEAQDRCGEMADEVNTISWSLATTPPTTLAGLVAVLRLANEVEDTGGDWPETDTIGAEGWHYQLRATMANAVEALT